MLYYVMIIYIIAWYNMVIAGGLCRLHSW